MACLRRICVLAAAALLVISCGRNGRVIPAHKLSKIYAEMLVLDQRIRNNPQLASTADTTLVYEPILNKYGYSGKDYAKSVARYMKDPEAFGKIFKDTREILDSHIKELKDAERARQKADSLRNAIEAKTSCVRRFTSISHAIRYALIPWQSALTRWAYILGVDSFRIHCMTDRCIG